MQYCESCQTTSLSISATILLQHPPDDDYLRYPHLQLSLTLTVRSSAPRVYCLANYRVGVSWGGGARRVADAAAEGLRALAATGAGWNENLFGCLATTNTKAESAHESSKDVASASIRGCRHVRKEELDALATSEEDVGTALR